MHKILHMLKLLPLRLAVMTCTASAVLCWSCDDQDQGLTSVLTTGYWLAEQNDNAGMMLTFAPSGHIFCYSCAPAAGGSYDAYYDSSLTAFYKYAVDFDNGRLCFLPDQWFDILVLDESVLSLSADDGTAMRFSKVDAGSVNVVSPEQFQLLHPDFVQ